MRRRLSDQALILEAIGEVRLELRHGMTMMETTDVVTRLCTLYSLLDVARLKVMVKNEDKRDRSNKERKVA